MKKESRAKKTYERLNVSIIQENRPPKAVEEMLLKDIEMVLKSYFVYREGEFRSLFTVNSGCHEFAFTLKYSHFKDIKIL